MVLKYSVLQCPLPALAFWDENVQVTKVKCLYESSSIPPYFSNALSNKKGQIEILKKATAQTEVGIENV